MQFHTPSRLEVLFREELEDKPAHVPHKLNPHAWASEALNCSRRLGLRLLGAAEESSPSLSTLIAWEVGSFLHERVQKVLEGKLGSFSEFEVDLGPVTGRADGVYFEPDGTLVVVEIKSMTSWALDRAIKVDSPNDEHLMQASLVASHVGAPKIHMIYVNKAARPSEEAFRDWLLEVDQEKVELELLRLDQVVNQAADGIVPEPWYQGEILFPPNKKQWPCSFCPYLSACKIFGPDTLQLRPPLPLRPDPIRPAMTPEAVLDRLEAMRLQRDATPIAAGPEVLG